MMQWCCAERKCFCTLFYFYWHLWCGHWFWN